MSSFPIVPDYRWTIWTPESIIPLDDTDLRVSQQANINLLARELVGQNPHGPYGGSEPTGLWIGRAVGVWNRDLRDLGSEWKTRGVSFLVCCCCVWVVAFVCLFASLFARLLQVGYLSGWLSCRRVPVMRSVGGGVS